MEELTDQPLRPRVVFDVDGYVHIAREADLAPYGNGEPADQREANTTPRQRQRDLAQGVRDGAAIHPARATSGAARRSLLRWRSARGRGARRASTGFRCPPRRAPVALAPPATPRARAQCHRDGADPYVQSTTRRSDGRHHDAGHPAGHDERPPPPDRMPLTRPGEPGALSSGDRERCHAPCKTEHPLIRLVHERTTHQDRAAERDDRHARSANATYRLRAGRSRARAKASSASESRISALATLVLPA